jgi:DNA polymerase-3 subunit delta
MILKSYIVEKNFNILNNYQAILLYGENDGIKDEIKSKLKKVNKKSEVINFFESEIIKNKDILYENIVNDSLFTEYKIIFIQLATDKILNEITECLEKYNEKIKIFIFSENLEKKSKLRNLFEKKKELAVLACYEDNEITLINYVNKELEGFKGLTRELINLIITNSGFNRKIIQCEIVKIKSFFLENKIIKKDLLEILNIKNNTRFEEMRDNVLNGKKDKLNSLFSETDLPNEESYFYLNNINYRILNLIEIKKKKEASSSYENVLENFKPPIFWKDKPIYIQQLKKWSLKQLYKAANEILDAEILMKKNSQIRNDILIKNLMISLSKRVSTSSLSLS